jgi:hypothetical protein
MNPRDETSIRSDRLTQRAFERGKVIRRSVSRISSWPAVREPRQQAGHMTAPSEGRLHRKNLANRAVPHMSQSQFWTPIPRLRGSILQAERHDGPGSAVTPTSDVTWPPVSSPRPPSLVSCRRTASASLSDQERPSWPASTPGAWLSPSASEIKEAIEFTGGFCAA